MANKQNKRFSNRNGTPLLSISKLAHQRIFTHDAEEIGSCKYCLISVDSTMLHRLLEIMINTLTTTMRKISLYSLDFEMQCKPWILHSELGKDWECDAVVLNCSLWYISPKRSKICSMGLFYCNDGV